MAMKSKGIFDTKTKSFSLARKISIINPNQFRKSIRILKKDGINLSESKALVLARTRATAQLNRKNLSAKERRQFKAISLIKIPKVSV